jgi:hypothetical protein
MADERNEVFIIEELELVEMEEVIAPGIIFTGKNP